MPGLLQTEGYVRAITAANFPAATPDFTERTVALRLARQQLLQRTDPPSYWVVMDETVLRRPIGGPDVMRGQLNHLIEYAQRPDITIQIIPFTAGWHPALYGMFNIFRFADEQMPDIVYSEALTGAYYMNKPEETARYTQALDTMCAQAAAPDQTVTILRDLIREPDMEQICNGMPAASLGAEGWHKPWSDNGGSCLEAKKLPGGKIALRQSSDPGSPALIFERREFEAFVTGAKAGLVDDLLT